MLGDPLNPLHSLSSKLNFHVFLFLGRKKVSSFLTSSVLLLFLHVVIFIYHFSQFLMASFLHSFINQFIMSEHLGCFLRERRMDLFWHFWFMCLIFSEAELITCGRKGCQVMAKLLKTALKCCIPTMFFFKGFSRMGMLWFFRDKSTSEESLISRWGWGELLLLFMCLSWICLHVKWGAIQSYKCVVCL